MNDATFMRTITTATITVLITSLAIFAQACGGMRPAFLSSSTATPAIAVPTVTLTAIEHPDTFILLADEEAKAISNRLPGLDTQSQQRIPLESLLRDAGINVARLRVVDRYIGNCLNTVTYELSKSYVLIIDDNACFGTRVFVANKP